MKLEKGESVMKIEILFPEICNLYGELFNIRYLKESLENSCHLDTGAPVYDVEVIETHLNDKPLFVREMPDLIYMGTMTENNQMMAVRALIQYKSELRKCIEKGVHILLTGNAAEVLGNRIIEDDYVVTEGLGLIDMDARRSSIDRYNSLYVGEFDCGYDETLKIVGFKSLFGFTYGTDVENKPAFNTLLGYASNEETKCEGVRINNLIATAVIGPLLVLNPLLTKWYMNEVFQVGFNPVYFKEAMDSYESRLEEYLAPGKGWKYE